MRFTQYRLITLFVLVTFVSALLAILARREHQYRERVDAVRVLADHGWHVAAGGEANWHHVGDGSTLQRAEVVHHVRCILDDSETISYAEARVLQSLPTVKELYIQGTADSDVPTGTIDPLLAEVAALHKLEAFCLARTTAGDAGIRYFKEQRWLRFLELGETRISDAALDVVRIMAPLQRLGIEYTAVTDAGISRLASLASLRELNISGTNITGAGFAELASLQRLEEVSLDETPFSDDGSRQLVRVSSQILAKHSGGPSP